MSQVYASEPATSGRVIFDTTHGPLEIQLWCRECPTTTKFFVQLCLDGFYDDVLFHRILPNTLLQCGALRSNQKAAVDLDQSRAEWVAYRQATQAMSALERRQYELHSRLRFSHRGLVAMALPSTEESSNELSDDDLVQQQTQFFVTLEEATYLDGKHVIFGTVAGPTIFNALRMGRVEVDESTGQPLDMQDAPRIKSVKIADNPVHTNLAPQSILPWRVAPEKAAKKKKKKRKGKLDTNVLSFGDELEDEIAARPAKRIKPVPVPVEKEGDYNDSVSDKKESRMSSSPPPSKLDLKRSMPKSDRLNEAEASSSPRAPLPGDKAKDESSKAEHRRPKLSAVEARRAKYAAGKKSSKKDRQEATMEKLLAFQGRVKDTVVASKTEARSSEATDNSLAARMARRAEQQRKSRNDEVEAYHGQVLEGKDDDKLDYQRSSKWMATTFKCRRHIDHSAGSDGRRAEDYEVFDGPTEEERR